MAVAVDDGVGVAVLGCVGTMVCVSVAPGSGVNVVVLVEAPGWKAELSLIGAKVAVSTNVEDTSGVTDGEGGNSLAVGLMKGTASSWKACSIGGGVDKS